MLFLKVLIVGINLILLIILFCEILGLVSEKNRHRQRDLVNQLPGIDKQIAHSQKQLSQFKGVSAQHYKAVYDSAAKHLSQAKSKRDKIKQLRPSISHPNIPIGQTSTVYFLKNLVDLRTVWHVSKLLGTMEQLADEININLSELATLIKQLNDVTPLRTKFKEIKNRLQQIADILREERQMGLEALGVYENRLPLMRETVTAVDVQVNKLSSLTIIQRDELAQEIEKLDEDSQALLDDVLEVRQQRQLVDQMREWISSSLPVPIPNLVESLYRALQTWLNVATLAKRQVALAQAQSYLGIATDIKDLILIVLGTDERITEIDLQKNNTLIVREVNSLRPRFNQIYSTIPSQINAPSVNTGFPNIPANIRRNIQLVTRQFQSLDQTINEVWLNHNRAISQLTEKADAAVANMDHNWEVLSTVVNLNHDDRLAISVQETRLQRQMATGDVRALQETISSADKFADTLDLAYRELRQAFTEWDRTLVGLKTAPEAADQEVGSWVCLQKQATTVFSCVSMINEEVRLARGAKYLDDTDRHLERANEFRQKSREAYQRLVDENEKLKEAVARIDRLRSDVERMGTKVSPEKEESIVLMASDYYENAQKAENFTDALDQLGSAEILWQKLRVR